MARTPKPVPGMQLPVQRSKQGDGGNLEYAPQANSGAELETDTHHETSRQGSRGGLGICARRLATAHGGTELSNSEQTASYR